MIEYERVSGVVVGVEPFGVFVDLDDGRSALLEVVNFAGERPFDLTDYPKPGTRLTAALIGVAGGQVRLSMRPTDLARTHRVATNKSWRQDREP